MTDRERKEIANYVIVKDKILASGRDELTFASEISEQLFYDDTPEDVEETNRYFAKFIKTSPARLSDWYNLFWYYFNLENGDDL